MSFELSANKGRLFFNNIFRVVLRIYLWLC